MESILARSPAQTLLNEPLSAPSRIPEPARRHEPMNAIRRRWSGPGPASARRPKTLSGSMFQAARGCLAANETVWRKQEK
jgi:hypothetical protein